MRWVTPIPELTRIFTPMDAPLHTDGSTGGVSENAALSVNHTLGLLQEWLDKYTLATQEEAELEQQYKKALIKVATRRQEYADAIIKALQPSLVGRPQNTVVAAPIDSSHVPTPFAPPDGIDTTQPPQGGHDERQSTPKPEQHGKADGPDGASTIELLPQSQFKKRGALKKAVLKVFAQQDTFLSTDGVVRCLKAEFPEETFDNKHIVDSIRDGRRVGQLVGYRLTIAGTTRYTYLNGLTSFFTSVEDYSDVKIEEIKPEYQDKFRQQLSELDLPEMVSSVKPEHTKADVRQENLGI